MASTVYVARYKWFARLLTLSAAGMLVALGFLGATPWGAESEWLLSLTFAATYVIVGAAVVETFVRKTVFMEHGIHQRSIFGQDRFMAYQEVSELVIRTSEALIIKDRSNRKLKIHAMEGDPEKIVDAIAQFLNPEVMVFTV